jgi:SAM-dependent methyltransferase
MSERDRAKWDSRYAAGAYPQRSQPSDFLRQHSGHLQPGRALDIACGAGRNSLYLAQQGWQVDAIDISAVALERGQASACEADLHINWHCQDLLANPTLPRCDYQLIILFRFVAMQLLAQLPAHLAPGGLLIVEEHMAWPEPVTGPTSSRFRVEPGALKLCLSAMQVIFDEEGEIVDADGSTAALCRLVARKPD